MTKEDLEQMIRIPPKTKEETLWVNALASFLHNYVCIPKGENRVKFADELHLMLEGIETEMQLDGFIPWVRCDIKNIRIKVPEPIYEYKWRVGIMFGVDTITEQYLTEEEAEGLPFIKIEETKQERFVNQK